MLIFLAQSVGPCSLTKLLQPNLNTSFLFRQKFKCQSWLKYYYFFFEFATLFFITIIKLGIIKKSERGRGLWRKLMLMLEEYCAKLGYRKLILGASTDKARLFLQLGYRYTGSRYTMIGSMVRIDITRIRHIMSYREFHIVIFWTMTKSGPNIPIAPMNQKGKFAL